MRELVIDGRRIADDEPCYVIAELGNTHQGDVAIARELIDVCATADVDAVKFQAKTIRAVYTRALRDVPYEHEQSFGKTYGEHKAALELSPAQYQICARTAAAYQLTCFATPFDERSADRLMEAQVPAFKIASGDLTNTPLLAHVAAFGLPMIVSTGGGTLADIDRAVQQVTRIHAHLALLHCTAAYPPAPEELNLRAIPQLRDRYPELVIGWSSHDPGVPLSLVAHALGAAIIEKHVTLNRTMKGTDHAFALEPKGIQTLVADLHTLRAALGDGQKRRYASEEAPLRKLAKSLVATRSLPIGHVLRPEDICAMSPATGWPPYRVMDLIGRTTTQPVPVESTLTQSNTALLPLLSTTRTHAKH